MISPKIAMLTAMMAVSTVGMTAVPALAQDFSQSIDRNNQIAQSITQSNEACTNTLVAISSAEANDNDFSDDNTAESEVEVDADQSNKCKVSQSNEAEQEAEIEDESENDLFNIFLAEFS
jgi:hypothetical protein